MSIYSLVKQMPASMTYLVASFNRTTLRNLIFFSKCPEYLWLVFRDQLVILPKHCVPLAASHVLWPLVVILDNLTEMLFDLVVWDQFVVWECRWFEIFNEGFDFSII